MILGAVLVLYARYRAVSQNKLRHTHIGSYLRAVPLCELHKRVNDIHRFIRFGENTVAPFDFKLYAELFKEFHGIVRHKAGKSRVKKTVVDRDIIHQIVNQRAGVRNVASSLTRDHDLAGGTGIALQHRYAVSVFGGISRGDQSRGSPADNDYFAHIFTPKKNNRIILSHLYRLCNDSLGKKKKYKKRRSQFERSSSFS